MHCYKKSILLAVFLTTIYGCGQSGSDPEQVDTNPKGNTNPDAPTLTSIGNKAVESGKTLTFTVSATDPNTLSLT